MILIVNNSEKIIEHVSWTKKIKNIIDTLNPDENALIVNENDEMNKIIQENKLRIKGVILGGSELRINNKQCLDKILDNILFKFKDEIIYNFLKNYDKIIFIINNSFKDISEISETIYNTKIKINKNELNINLNKIKLKIKN